MALCEDGRQGQQAGPRAGKERKLLEGIAGSPPRAGPEASGSLESASLESRAGGNWRDRPRTGHNAPGPWNLQKNQSALNGRGFGENWSTD